MLHLQREVFQDVVPGELLVVDHHGDGAVGPEADVPEVLDYVAGRVLVVEIGFANKMVHSLNLPKLDVLLLDGVHAAVVEARRSLEALLEAGELFADLFQRVGGMHYGLVVGDVGPHVLAGVVVELGGVVVSYCLPH